MVFVPFADFRPDSLATLYNNDAMPQGALSHNTLPMSDGTDGSIRVRAALMSAGAANPLGFHSVNEDTWFYGSAAALYKANLGTTLWSDVSGAAYATTIAAPWDFCVFGDRVIATNLTNAVQVYQIGVSAAFGNLHSDAPKARYCATIEPGFVVLGGINDGASKPRTVRWSGINDATSWPVVGTSAASAAQSDEQELPQGGDVTAILPGVGGASAAVFTERAIYRMNYIGPPSVFEIKPVVTHIGCAAPRSAIAIGGVAYFYSNDGFFAFDGTNLRPIGEGRVNRWFKAALTNSNFFAESDFQRMFVGHDSFRKVIAWAFPNAATATAGTADWRLHYNYVSDRWRFGAAATLTTDWLGTAKYGAVDGVVGFGTDRILYHWDAPGSTTLVASFETGDFDGGSGSGRRVAVTGARLITDAPDADVTLRVGSRENLDSAVSYSAATSPGVDGRAPARVAGRFCRIRSGIAAGTDWNWARGVDFDVRVLGRR